MLLFTSTYFELAVEDAYIVLEKKLTITVIYQASTDVSDSGADGLRYLLEISQAHDKGEVLNL